MIVSAGSSAAFYPEGMTTIAASGRINELARVMGSQGRLDPVERHTFVRSRPDEALGERASHARVPFAKDVIIARLSSGVQAAWMIFRSVRPVAVRRTALSK